MLEGYGQTECTAASCCTVAGDMSTGHVGPPLPCNYKLVDVYNSADVILYIFLCV